MLKNIHEATLSSSSKTGGLRDDGTLLDIDRSPHVSGEGIGRKRRLPSDQPPQTRYEIGSEACRRASIPRPLSPDSMVTRP